MGKQAKIYTGKRPGRQRGVTSNQGEVFLTPQTSTIAEVFTDSTSGTFTISHSGNASGNIAFDASAATVETAFEGITGITAAAVTGSGTKESPWVITMQTPAGDTADLTVNGANLVAAFQDADRTHAKA